MYLAADPTGSVTSWHDLKISRVATYNQHPRLAAMNESLLPLGGLVSSARLIAFLRCKMDQPISTVAKWIVGRRVLSLEAMGEVWMPLFQFEPRTMQVLPGVNQIFAELLGGLDEWEAVEWFITPHARLNGAVPAMQLALDAARVLEAARADRIADEGRRGGSLNSRAVVDSSQAGLA